MIRGNLFQAKATLESIIQNHEGDDIVNESRKKWEKIVEQEKKEKKKEESDEYYIDIFEEDVDYELVFSDSLTVIDFDFEVTSPDSLEFKKDSLNIY